ncbi:TrlF family AAA-like ATPase [Thiolapillus sp.]|uniref:TrlF family AAA-like ATPase n=1 Tax=Thiolapillus sp. TaxID=2017437 RepID=UPI003AF5BE82
MTVCNEKFPNGGRWLRADFHLHTKADNEFPYSGEENSFISDYVNALNKARIKVGIITNHNKFALDEFKALCKKARKKGIYLLPGVELSVKEGSNGVHMLVVFSDDWISDGRDYINPFIVSEFQGRTPDQYENENACSNNDILTTLKNLHDQNKQFFVVFAHVEQNSGLWKSLDGGLLKKLGQSPIFQQYTLGFQKVRSYNKVEQGKPCRTKVKDGLEGWYPAEVEGSDPKAIDQIGKGQITYLKIGDFTFGAVKYALLDHANRLATEPTTYKHSHILSVSFDGGVLDGKTVNLSPELNTLIGIRGSGKSSIVEAIRYALDIPFGVKALDTDYKRNLIDHVLGSGGKVTVHAVDSRGQRYEIRRINKEMPDVYIDGILQPGISIRETILHKPIYFGQKDLSATGEGFEKDLVEKLVGEILSEIRSRIEMQRQKVSELVSQLKKLSNTEEKKKEYEDKKRDAEFRLKFYKAHGVEERLQKQVDFDADSRKCTNVISFVQSYLADLDGFVSQYEDDLANQRIYTSKQNKDFFDEFFAVYDKLITSFGQIKNALSEGNIVLTQLKEKASDFEKLKESLKEEFAEIERKLSEQLRQSGAQAIRPDEFRQLRKTVEQTSQLIRALDKQESVRNNLQQELLKELAKLNDLWREEYKAIHAELDKVNSSHSSLEIKAEFKGDKTAFLTFMRDIYRGSRIREATLSHLDEFSDFGAIYKELSKAKGLLGNSAQVFEKYFIENLSALLTWQPPNRFVIEYRGKELKHHSLGQRASALILFVLSQQENDVFIIDQPEDDLDNQTIYEDVIKLIRTLKHKTQFIFATHNANFPVLGDAEQVISCSYSDEAIQVLSGSIDCPKMQQEIVDIMEGGEEAFEQRKRRYEIWKPQNS